ncbi:outer membrane transport energization protein ExbD [Nitrospirillum amazonense]|uniref:Biopolymer transport protein ExbD n=1 Tax=Nitrospirillum amazonense TaxID=28077 RepID=A0A560FTB7_9PROT|nr:TonB system transport protein ExbD [Nitrospirillum amazonense]TWB24873.1 outer membrane transport energization protein ExbD [Nitrospirillum amazonense]
MAARLSHGGDELAETHEINVTPFIDVMLVLLIIFMVAAPLATVDVPVDLPSSNAPPRPHPEKPVTLTIRADLTLAVDGADVARDGLAAALDQAAGGDKEQRITLSADRVVSYGDLTAVMNSLRSAGYLKVSLVGLDGGGAP